MTQFRNLCLASATAAALGLMDVPVASAAGNVTATVQKGVLRIVGDGGDNSIVVTGTMSTSAYEISSGDGTTTINGGPGPITTPVANQQILIEMEQGNNTLDVNNATFSRQVRITFGPGDDTLEFTNVVINKNLNLAMGEGENTIDFLDSAVSENSKIKTGKGVDAVLFDGVQYRGRLFTSDGDDIVSIVNSSHVQPKAKLVIKTGNGDDSIEMTNLFWNGKVLANFGSGNDTLTTGAITVGLKVKITGASGTDTLINNGAHVGVPEFVSFP
jgi:hypothetical protein